MFLPIFKKNKELNKLKIKLEKFQKEIKIKESEIRKARKTLNRTNTIARIGTWEVNLKKEKVTWSAVTKEIHEVDVEFIPDVSTAINFYKEGYSRDKVKEVIDNSIKNNINWDEELQIVTKNGKDIWVRAIGKTLFKNEKPVRMFGTFQDINSAKIAQIELKKANEELGAILNLDTISIIRTDTNGIITYFNEGAETLLGYKSEEIVNIEKPSLFHDKKEIIKIGKELSEKYNKEISGFGVFETLALQDEDVSRKFKYTKKDGSYLYMQLSINAIRDKNGAIIAFIGVGTDITKLTEQNNQLASFAQIASHNLRAPVSNLSSLLTLYDISETEEDKKFTFDKFRTVISHLSDTLHTLIQAIKIREKKEAEIQVEKLSFSEVFQKTIEITSEEIKKLNAKITSDFSAIDVIEYNESYLESAFINLISNSLRYSSPERSPKIEVKTSLKNGKVQLSIKDNGLGIDLEKHGHRMFGLNHVFHRHKDSQGVGLYMLKNQIEALKGTITCISEVNKGTTFTITF
jgi:PAS domain S-box-containing protein